MDERTWRERDILTSYKWANGFTKKKMNKLQMILGNGVAWGMIYAIGGFGMIPHFLLGLYLVRLFHNENGMGVSLILMLVIGVTLQLYCKVQEDKITYNKMIDREAQMNLFRDFGIEMR